MNINWIGLYTLISREFTRIMRTSVQAIFMPLINATLYIVIFGYIIGERIRFIPGISYIEFVFPGILLLNIATTAFLQSAFSLYLHRFQNVIDEVVMAPLSPYEITFGYIAGSIARAICVGLCIYIIAICFNVSQVSHVGLFIVYVLLISIIFGSVGLIKGLWAESFEQLSLFQTFIINPLAFLGCMFNSLEMLPKGMQVFMYFNPFFYFIDGMRYAMTGYQETSSLSRMFFLLLATALTLGIATGLMKKGYKIKH